MGDETVDTDRIDRAIEWFNANPGPREGMLTRLLADYPKLTYTKGRWLLHKHDWDEAAARRWIEGRLNG